MARTERRPPVRALAPVLLLLSACYAQAPEPTVAACDSGWRPVYAHDADGRPTAGSKDSLMNMIRRGSSIRLAWGVAVEREGGTVSVEHIADPVFVTIASGREVTAQLPEHVDQSSYVAGDASFGEAAVMWRGMMSTDGTFDAVWVNRASGQEVRRLPQRAAITWLADAPPAGCPLTEPLELAVPGGVRANQ